MPTSRQNPIRGAAKALQQARRRASRACHAACRRDPGTVFINGQFQRPFKYERVVLQFKDGRFNNGRVYTCRIYPDGRRERIGVSRYY